MKARIVWISLIASLIVTAAADLSLAERKWQGGLKGGLNVSQFRGNSVAPWIVRSDWWMEGTVGNSLSGFVGGAFVRRQFVDRFALQVEALYSQKGGDGTVYGQAEFEYPSNVWYRADINGTLTVRLDYVEFPVLAAFTFPPGDKVGFTVLLGPSFGFNTRAEAHLEGEARVPKPNESDQVKNFDEKIPIQDRIRNYEIAGVVGAALEFELSNSVLVLDGRYTFGLTSIDTNDQETYNNVFSITVGFMAPFKR